MRSTMAMNIPFLIDFKQILGTALALSTVKTNKPLHVCAL